MSYIRRTRTEPKVVTTNELSNRLDILEDTNTKLSQWLRLKIKQIDELDNKVNNSLADVELRKVVQKLSDDFASIQNTTINSKTIDVMINSKMDTINKNVKGFSELIENKLINKITKLEEYCNTKFKILDTLNSRIESIESSIQNVPTVEDLTTFSKQFSERLDTFENKIKSVEESLENQMNLLHKKFSDELPLVDDIKVLDQGICQKFEKIENYVLNLNGHIKNELETIKASMNIVSKSFGDLNTIEKSSEEEIINSQQATPEISNLDTPDNSSVSVNEENVVADVPEVENLTDTVSPKIEEEMKVQEVLPKDEVTVINEEEAEFREPKRRNKRKTKGKK